MRTPTILSALAAAALCVSAATAGEIDDKAQKTINKVKSFYTSLDAFHLSYDSKMTITWGTQVQTEESNISVDLAKPNLFKMHTEHPQLGQFEILCDGAEVVTYMNNTMIGRKVYTQINAPATLAEVLDQTSELINLSSGPASIDASSIAISLAADPESDKIFDTVSSGEYIGVEQIGETNTHHISLVFSTEIDKLPLDIPIDIWVEQGEQAWIRQVVPDISAILAAMPDNAGLPPGISFTSAQTLNNATATPDFEEGTFAFTAPEGAEKVDSLFDALTETPPQAQSQPQPAGGLLGNPAPAFSLELLGGDTVDLAQHKGKDIVVLDFWATWCGPCVKAMPTLIEVTNGFKDNNVVFYAVNLREDNDKISGFLKKKGLSTNILLDKTGATASAYGANAIPQTVIIDKAGNVQAVHVGLAPNLKQMLTEELQKLVNGENLY